MRGKRKSCRGVGGFRAGPGDEIGLVLLRIDGEYFAFEACHLKVIGQFFDGLPVALIQRRVGAADGRLCNHFGKEVALVLCSHWTISRLHRSKESYRMMLNRLIPRSCKLALASALLLSFVSGCATATNDSATIYINPQTGAVTDGPTVGSQSEKQHT